MNDHYGLKKFHVRVVRYGYMDFWAKTEEEAIYYADCLGWDEVNWDEFGPKTDAVVFEVTEESED